MIKGLRTSVSAIYLSFLSLFCAPVLFGQTQTEDRSDRISDCFGAVDLPDNGSFSIAFPEEPGIYLDLDNYKNINRKIPQRNSIWLKFSPEIEGKLNLKITFPEKACHLVLFDVERENSCETIMKAKAKVLLDTIVDVGKFFIENQDFLNRNDPSKVLYVYFNYAEKHRNKIFVESRFQSPDFERTYASLLEEVDQRVDKSKPTYRISFRDEDTRLPVLSRAIIKGSSVFNAMYNGTDLLFTLDETLDFSLRLDAIGYFPLDTNLKVSKVGNIQHEIFLEPVASGKQISLKGIEFQPESAVFMNGAQKKLTRVRDFLALNSELKIEVQGHVHQFGKNDFGSRRLSKLRAKAVARYLIEAGISEDRIEYNGYGNTAMIFPEAETEAEMQANRRVEIHIK